MPLRTYTRGLWFLLVVAQRVNPAGEKDESIARIDANFHDQMPLFARRLCIAKFSTQHSVRHHAIERIANP